MTFSIRSKGRISEFHDIYEVLEKVSWLWRILGIFPIVIKRKNFKKIYEFSIFHATIGILTYVILILDFIYLAVEYRQSFSHVPLLTVLSFYIRVVSNLICVSFIAVWRIIKFKELSDIINDLSGQEIILKKANYRIDYDSSSRIIHLYVWTTFLTMIYTMIYDTVLAYRSFGFQIEWIIWPFSLLIQKMDVTVLVSLVGLLGLRFHSINEKLTEIVTKANASLPKMIGMSDVCAENLRILSKLHYDICEIGKRINRFYCTTVIIHVTAAFVILSMILYYILDEIQRKDKMNTTVMLSYVHLELNYGIPIIIIVIICNWTSNQAIHTGTLLHEIRVTNADSKLYDVVKSFSLQLHHQKLEFTGGGFFPLDLNLLQTMAGKITTYLVILIQFHPNLYRYWNDN